MTEADDRGLYLEAVTPEITQRGDGADKNEDIPELQKYQRTNSQDVRSELTGDDCDEGAHRQTGAEVSPDDDERETKEPLLQQPPEAPPDSPEVMQEEDEDDGIPYDKGWAWMVCLGSFICFVCLSGYLKSAGMIFVALLQQFNAPASKTALLFALRAAIFSITGLYVMNVVVTRLGTRKTVLTGAVLMSLSAITSSFADELAALICLQSLLLGVGMAMAVSPGEVLMGSYFKKRRSLALAIAKCGASVGGIAIPPLLTYLIEQYGLRGTLLLYGGICLNTIPAALLLRPTSSFSRKNQRSKGESVGDKQADIVEVSLELVDEVGKTGGGDGKTRTMAVYREYTKTGFSNPSTARSGGDGNAKPGLPVVIEDSGNVFDGSNGESEGPHSPSHDAVISMVLQSLKDSEVVQGPPRRQFHFSLSHDYDASVRKKDTVVHDTVKLVSELTSSFPDLTLEEAEEQEHPFVFRKRTTSEPPKEYAPTSHHAEEEKPVAQSSALDTLSGSRLIRYISVSTLALGSMPVLCQFSSGPRDDTASEGSSGKIRSRCMTIARFILTCPKKAIFMLDFSLFRRPVFRLLVFYFMLSPVINCNLDYLPAIAIENGVTETQASLLLSVIGGLDLVCRLVSGFIADSGRISVPTMIIITYVTMGVINQFVRFLTTYPMFLALAALQGLLGGVGNALAAVLIIDFVGLENMGKAIGFAQLFSGASLSAIYPLLGFIRDSTGSYVMVYHAVGIMTISAAGLLALVGVVRRWERVPDKERRRDTEADVLSADD